MATLAHQNRDRKFRRGPEPLKVETVQRYTPELGVGWRAQPLPEPMEHVVGGLKELPNPPMLGRVGKQPADLA
jgi:hypothetical protein